MRIWSVHPRYLDRQALVACWRETLLAQAVLAGDTRGYTRHPQLARFQSADEPLALIGDYLAGVAAEADARGYRFDRSRIRHSDGTSIPLDVSDGQLDYEWAHLRRKLEARSPEIARQWAGVRVPDPHPLLRVVPGPIADWERP